MSRLSRYMTILAVISILVLSACGASTGQNLSGTSWKLVSYGSPSNPTPAMKDVSTNLTFEAGNRLSGNAGCNSFGGEYQLKGSQLIFGSIMSTLMACEGQRMEQEAAVFKVLAGTANFSLDNGTLTIVSSDEAAMATFTRVEK